MRIKTVNIDITCESASSQGFLAVSTASPGPFKKGKKPWGEVSYFTKLKKIQQF